MLDQLSNFISKQKLFQPDEHILLAVSGGIDSVVMLHLLKRAGTTIAIAHCNFQLRGEASDGDEAFIRKLAVQFEVPLFTKRFDTESYAKKHRVSIQMAARDLRRHWFEETLEREDYSKIATAHHLNDSLETAVFNLAKGTGITGLQGILPKKDKYVRPLLFANREMIHHYAIENNLEWREDQSNSSVKYSRNLIRHKVIPELKKINPNLENTFAQTMEKIIGSTAIFKDFVENQKLKLLHKKQDVIEIDKAQIKNIENAQLILFELLESHGFNYAQVKDIIATLDTQSGKVFFSASHRLTVDREKLFLEENKNTEEGLWKISEDTKSLTINEHIFKIETLDSGNSTIDKNSEVAALDLKKLQFPLTMRYWQHGDVFFPLGMKHKKKVSDFMIDEKIPVNLKKRTLILLSGNELVWVVGHRIDDRFKITEKTRNIFRINIEAQ